MKSGREELRGRQGDREKERKRDAAHKSVLRLLCSLSLCFSLSPCLPVSLSPVLPLSTAAHKYHFSFTQLEYNAKEKTVEITIRVFADDLEAAISQRSGKSLKLDNKEAAAIVAAYVRDKLALKGRDGRAKRLTWVGMEPKVDVAFLYLEAKTPEGIGGAQFQQQMFFDLFADQVNQVLCKTDSQQASVDFKHGDGFKVIAFPAK